MDGEGKAYVWGRAFWPGGVLSLRQPGLRDFQLLVKATEGN